MKTGIKKIQICFNIKNSGINWKKNNKDIKQERKIEQDNQLKELLNFGEEIRSNFLRKEIYGFPINLSFTTLREIWEQLKLTNVHLIGGDNSELCLSVYVFSYSLSPMHFSSLPVPMRWRAMVSSMPLM